MTDAEGLQRFVAEAASLSPEMARWAAALVWRGLSPARRRQIRDDLLREAARQLPPVSAWQKAHLLAELTRRPRPGARPDVTTPAGLVALAMGVYPGRGALSAGQVFRIVFRKSPVEMRVAGPVGCEAEPAFLMRCDDG